MPLSSLNDEWVSAPVPQEPPVPVPTRALFVTPADRLAYNHVHVYPPSLSFSLVGDVAWQAQNTSLLRTYSSWKPPAIAPATAAAAAPSSSSKSSSNCSDGDGEGDGEGDQAAPRAATANEEGKGEGEEVDDRHPSLPARGPQDESHDDAKDADDTPSRAFLLAIKHWAARRGVNDVHNSTLTTYAWMLLGIHYLQVPPCAPLLVPDPYLGPFLAPICSHYLQVRLLSMPLSIGPLSILF